MTSPRELAECLRRIFFAEHLPESDRYRLSPEQLEFLKHGGRGLIGLETRLPSSGAAAWKGGFAIAFPNARYFHKNGVISTYALEASYVDDSKASGTRFIAVPVIAAGESAKPVSGDKLVAQLARVIGQWVKAQSLGQDASAR